MSDFDASLMQDFLTESSELIEQLDADLVKPESADESEQADLLNASFRLCIRSRGPPRSWVLRMSFALRTSQKMRSTACVKARSVCPSK